jgi:hypothetical protein
MEYVKYKYMISVDNSFAWKLIRLKYSINITMLIGYIQHSLQISKMIQ